MKDRWTPAERLAPDTVAQLQRAALHRFQTAELLRAERRLAAIYFYGYSAEMALCCAYYRAAGFRPYDPIDREARTRRMAQARQLRTPAGEPLMSSDPHPLVGWSRFVAWIRSADPELPTVEAKHLREAVEKAILIYNYWRPELRYKTVQFADKQIEEVQRAAKWLLDHMAEL